MKNIQSIQALASIATTLETLPARYAKALEDPKCDKRDFSFGGDDRFSVFSSKINLTCYTGYYGNSGCSTMGSVDSTIATRLLHKVLNKQREEILRLMAQEARNEAALLESQARAELASLAAQLDAAVHQPVSKP